MDFITRTLGSFTGPSIPYNIGAVIDQSYEFPTIWTIHEGTKKADGTKCTLFVFDAKVNGSKLPLARNFVQKLKKLRIPGVVKILDSVETDTSLIVATEYVQPLYKLVEDLSVDTKVWGLHNVIKTLEHVTNNGYTHGNINLSTIYVNHSGEWLIGGLECATKNDEEQVLYTYGGLLPGSTRCAPPEVATNGWQVAQRNPLSVDVYLLGVLIYEVFNGTTQSGSRNARGKIPSTGLWNVQKQLCQVDPKKRLSISKLKSNSAQWNLFQSAMVEVEETVTSLTIISPDQFNMFLDKLNSCIDKFPAAYLQNKILPALIEALNKQSTVTASSAAPGALSPIFGATKIKAMTTIIQLAKGLPQKEFTTIVSPTIIKLFAEQDRAIRLELLKTLPDYIELLDKKLVSDKIFPSLAFGFTDAEPIIRENTLRSVVHLMPKLNDRIVNGELLRLLAKTQNDTVPELRANTTILLGRIASNFSQSTRGGVLIAAFARALKDPFVQSRLAALLALSHTATYYTPQDLCGRVVGALAPSLIDKDRGVRQQAAITMDAFMATIRVHAAKLDDSSNVTESEATSAVAAAGTSLLKGWGWGGGKKEIVPSAIAAEQLHPTDRTNSAPIISTSTPNQSDVRNFANISEPQHLRPNSAVPLSSGSPLPPIPTGDQSAPFDHSNAFDDNWNNDIEADDNDDDGWNNDDLEDDDDDDDDAWNNDQQDNKWFEEHRVTKKTNKLSLEPEDDEENEDGWGWD